MLLEWGLRDKAVKLTVSPEGLWLKGKGVAMLYDSEMCVSPQWTTVILIGLHL